MDSGQSQGGVGIQPFPDDYFWSRDFFLFKVSQHMYLQIHQTVSFFLSLIKIYTQNFRLHYFLNHHHLKISTDNIVSFPQNICIVTGKGILRASLSHNNGQEVVPLAPDIPASWEPPGRRLSCQFLGYTAQCSMPRMRSHAIPNLAASGVSRANICIPDPRSLITASGFVSL